MNYRIPFNKAHLTGKELKYIQNAVESGKISGDGSFTKKCHSFFEEKYKFKKCLLTTSCTDALEMTALLLKIKPGDEVIMPSYTFVSTANPFIMRGAKIIFADSEDEHPNMDTSKIEALINKKTKAIIVVHYAGVACDMDTILQLAQKHNLAIVEDAAQAVDSFYKGRPLGGIGTFGTFSFHETKNIQAGEGGMLVINDGSYKDRAEIIREKGTNRAAFFRNEVDKYGWVDIGSSFLPSDIISAFLFAQLENLNIIQAKRIEIWNIYYDELQVLETSGKIKLPKIPNYATNNAHMFYILTDCIEQRSELINYLKDNSILSVFHYISLHSSMFYKDNHDGRKLVNADKYSDVLLRLPLYYNLLNIEVKNICNLILKFYTSH